MRDRNRGVIRPLSLRGAGRGTAAAMGLSAALIALYSLTQLAGPWLTGIWLNMGGTLHSAFWLGAGALLWGLIWMLLVPRPR